MAKKMHIVCVIDRSGSMSVDQDEVINGFNSFIAKQKKLPGDATLTLVLFDHEYKMVYDKKNLADVPGLDRNTYTIGGMTALNDAVGRTIAHMSRKKNVIFLIMTDGHENASDEFKDGRKVKALIESKSKWDFEFIGAGIDAFNSAGKGFGLSQHTTQTVEKSKVGYSSAFLAMSDISTSYRSTGLKRATS